MMAFVFTTFRAVRQVEAERENARMQRWNERGPRGGATQCTHRPLPKHTPTDARARHTLKAAKDLNESCAFMTGLK